MRLDGVEHWDHFQDETIYWLDLSDMPEPIQQAARRIDGKAYNDRCFGICVVHDLATNEYAVVTESGTSPEVDRNIFYVDNDGDKHWFQADLPDTLVKEMFSCCEDVHAGKLLPQGYQALSSVLFDNETGFVSGENQAAKSPFSTWQLRIDHGHPEYYTPHYHTDRESAEQDLNGRVAEYKRYHTIREKTVNLRIFTPTPRQRLEGVGSWTGGRRVSGPMFPAPERLRRLFAVIPVAMEYFSRGLPETFWSNGASNGPILSLPIRSNSWALSRIGSARQTGTGSVGHISHRIAQTGTLR